MSRVDPLFNGQNHVIFNLYSGSFPDYRELDFAFNQNYGTINEILKKGNNLSINSWLTSKSHPITAILVKASQSRESYRKDFDISFPLFSRNHPKRGPPFVSHESQQIPVRQTMLRILLNFLSDRWLEKSQTEKWWEVGKRDAICWCLKANDIYMVSEVRLETLYIISIMVGMSLWSPLVDTERNGRIGRTTNAMKTTLNTTSISVYSPLCHSWVDEFIDLSIDTTTSNLWPIPRSVWFPEEDAWRPIGSWNPSKWDAFP